MTLANQNPDVIVIGAGTAGLSAASALKQNGLEVLVLEAADHVGGRCVTDASSFSIPFDMGGSWLHSAEINPLSDLAEQGGYKLFKTPWVSTEVKTPNARLNQKEVGEYVKYMEKMWEQIVQCGDTDKTSSIENVLPQSRYTDTAKLFIAQMLGGDFDVTSPADLADYADSDGDWLVQGGLGSFIAHLHSNVDVQLNCPVSKVDYSGRNVRVTTPLGTVEAAHVILTVSVGVLAAELIEFNPVLPNCKISAINGLPNGLLNKVGIEFDPEWCEANEGDMLDYHIGGEQYCSILFGFYGSKLATGFTAGRFATELENDGEGAATEFCLQALRDIFGNDITRYIRHTKETHWWSNSYTLGSYSYLSPGHHGAREALAESLNDRVFFAGEATISSAFATVHGAYLSGKQAADEVASKFKPG